MVSKFTNCVTIQCRLVTCEGTWVRTNGLPLETRRQHKQLLEIWLT